MNAAFYKGCLDLEYKIQEEAKVVKIVNYLKEEFGYEEIAGDENTIILGHSWTIREARAHYREAKA